ncbi:lipoprotein [Methylobacterium sp. J-078]|uniref:LPS translocon maturation chaperone LptM n=1 Tax=Methylobacterium sp. J-078 TaxID=2836657 RepID=UPI001FB8CFF5|nr:lipoprotein [Methylobacterium sp. J-078]MCJ2045103.1 lipoprotein [Methylobacterium sp. J-078]
MFLRSRHLPAIAVIGLVALATSGCGRRGALEPPPGTEAARAVARPGLPGLASPRALPQSVGLGGGTAAPSPDAVRSGDELDTLAVPGSGAEPAVKTTRGAKRGYVIPKQPFLLDPLL